MKTLLIAVLLCSCGGIETVPAVPSVCECSLAGMAGGFVPLGGGDEAVCTPACVHKGPIPLRLYGPTVPFCDESVPSCTAFGCCHWKTLEQLGIPVPDEGTP